MKVTPIRTPKVLPNDKDIFTILDEAITALPEKSVVVVTSKVVSLAQNDVLPIKGTDKEELIIQESDKYLPSSYSVYGHHFTITENTLIAGAGIDESNSADHYVLWPKDVQGSANKIRQHLVEHFGVKEVGVVITDSTCQPLRRGTTGIALAHSGFLAVEDYRGTKDLFGRKMSFSVSNISGGLAAAAVLTMGEGTEQTPVCLIEDVPFVQFQQRDPDQDELDFIQIQHEDDLFAPFLKSVPWQPGVRHPYS